MTDSQSATRADLEEFAAEIIASLDSRFLDLQSEVTGEISHLATKVNSLKIDTEDLKDGQKSIREDIGAFSSTFVDHELRIAKLERKAA